MNYIVYSIFVSWRLRKALYRQETNVCIGDPSVPTVLSVTIISRRWVVPLLRERAWAA